MNPTPLAADMAAPLVADWVSPDRWPGLHADWQRLAEADHRGGFFAGPQFAKGFADHFAGRADCSVLTLRRGDGSLAALLPMMISTVRRGRGLATRHDYLAQDDSLLVRPGRRPLGLRQISPLLGLEASLLATRTLCLPQIETLIWPAVATALKARAGWDIAVFPLADAARQALLTAATAQGMPSLTTRLDRPMQMLDPVASSETLIAAQSKKFRQNMRRASRFAEDAGITVTLLQDADAVAALPEFAALAARSWKSTPASERAQGEAVVIPYTGPQQALAESLARAPGLRPVLAVARANHQLRAACLAFATPRLLTPFVMVQDAQAGRESLGHLVLHQLIDHAHACGHLRLDYNANSGWLSAYVNHTEVIQNLTLFRPGLKGRALAMLAKATASP